MFRSLRVHAPVGDFTEITTRLGSDAAVVSNDWTIGADGQTAGLWDTAPAWRFALSMRGKDKLAVRLQRPQESRVEMIFSDLKGIDQVLDEVAKACPQ